MSDDKTPQPPKTESPKPSSGNKTLIIVVAVVVGVGLLGGVGYFLTQQVGEKSAEKAIEQATGGKANVDVSEGGDKVTIETDKGKVAIGQNEVPDSFPSDVTVYSGAKVIGSSESSAGISIVLETSDSVSKVSDFYKADLEKNGWKINATTNIGGSASYSAEKGTKLVVVGATPLDSGETNISITIADK